MSSAEMIGEEDGDCKGEFEEKGRILRRPLREIRGLTGITYKNDHNAFFMALVYVVV